MRWDLNEERTGDYCPHSETGVMPRMVRISREESTQLFRLAARHYIARRPGNALALLKVIGVRARKRPRGFNRLYRKVHASMNRTH